MVALLLAGCASSPATNVDGGESDRIRQHEVTRESREGADFHQARHIVFVGRERRVRADEPDRNQILPALVDPGPAAVHRGEKEADDGAAGDVDDERAERKAAAEAAQHEGGDAVTRQGAERTAERNQERMFHRIDAILVA